MSKISFISLRYFDQVNGLDTNDAKLFRLYKATFKRLPDENGLKYLIGKYTSGENDQKAVAFSFLNIRRIQRAL